MREGMGEFGGESREKARRAKGGRGEHSYNIEKRTLDRTEGNVASRKMEKSLYSNNGRELHDRLPLLGEECLTKEVALGKGKMSIESITSL